MRRVARLFFLMMVGCGGSPTSHIDTGPKEVPGLQGPAEEKKPEHDYNGWSRYAPADAQFEVRFPSEPIVQPPSQANGNLHVAGVERKTVNSLAFICQWTIEKQPKASRAAEAAYLMGQQIGAVNSTKGRLVEGKDITLGDVNGREFTVAVGKDDVTRVRGYLAGKRMISLQVVGKDTEAVRSIDAQKFLDSLQISK